jgi:uncharacterized protein (DUF952 family)/GNAT superfamily N-acetyltransferase
MIAHLLTPQDWQRAQSARVIRPASLDTEGFTHCSELHQVVRVANRFYGDHRALVIALIDTKRLTHPAVWEAPAHPDGSIPLAHDEFYPHIYGPIEVDAVHSTLSLSKEPHSKFLTPEEFTTFTVMPLPQHHWSRAAEWSHRAWHHEFPRDTTQTYLDQYAAIDPARPLEVYAAVSEHDELMGVATLVDDDELADPREPGPWIAAVYVDPRFRSRGVGSALVRHGERRAKILGHSSVYLYTEDKVSWYDQAGWQIVRSSTLNGLAVTVMRLEFAT